MVHAVQEKLEMEVINRESLMLINKIRNQEVIITTALIHADCIGRRFVFARLALPRQHEEEYSCLKREWMIRSQGRKYF